MYLSYQRHLDVGSLVSSASIGGLLRQGSRKRSYNQYPVIRIRSAKISIPTTTNCTLSSYAAITWIKPKIIGLATNIRKIHPHTSAILQIAGITFSRIYKPIPVGGETINPFLRCHIRQRKYR